MPEIIHPLNDQVVVRQQVMDTLPKQQNRQNKLHVLHDHIVKDERSINVLKEPIVRHELQVVLSVQRNLQQIQLDLLQKQLVIKH